MGRPPKPYAVLKSEGKSHRTKAELEARKKAEAAFATGEPLKEKQEVKENVVAHKEFLRLSKLLVKIGKADAIYENVINRYCLLLGECREMEKIREEFLQDLRDMEQERDELEPETYYNIKGKMQKNLVSLDRQVQAKRKMLMEIEKENIMTISSSLRNLPKKEEEPANPLLEALKGG